MEVIIGMLLCETLIGSVAQYTYGYTLIITVVVVVTCQLKNAGFSLPQSHFVFYYTLLVLSSVGNAGMGGDYRQN